MAKRTPEQAKSFFKRNTKNRGEGRELYKTSYDLIDSIVSNLISEKPFLKDKIWVDPCAGDGRWAEVIKNYGINCISFDIKPLNDKVFQGDFFITPYQQNDKYFFIGNPPFSLLKPFINRALSITNYCYFLGGSQVITGGLSDKVELLHRFEGFEGNQKDKRSKAVFLDTNNKDVLIWSCGALFTNDEYIPKLTQIDALEDNSFRVSIKKYCKEDKRIKIIKKGVK